MDNDGTSAPPPIGPFRGFISQETDLDGVTLTLPVSLRMLRLMYWFVVSLSVLMVVVTQPDSVFLASLSFFVGGFTIERVLLLLAHAVSRGSLWSKLFMWLMFAVLVMPSMVVSGFHPAAVVTGLALLLLMIASFTLMVGRTPTLRLDDRVLRMEEWLPVGRKRDRDVVRDGPNQVLTIPLEDIVSVERDARPIPWGLGKFSLLNQPAGCVVLKLADRSVDVWSGPLRKTEQAWLVRTIEQRVAERKAALAREGHDLDVAAAVPAPLQTLRTQS